MFKANDLKPFAKETKVKIETPALEGNYPYRLNLYAIWHAYLLIFNPSTLATKDHLFLKLIWNDSRTVHSIAYASSLKSSPHTPETVLGKS